MPSNNKKLVKRYYQFCEEFSKAVTERGWIAGGRDDGFTRGYASDVEGILLSLLRYVCQADI